jgi:hypothetical protein
MGGDEGVVGPSSLSDKQPFVKRHLRADVVELALQFAKECEFRPHDRRMSDKLFEYVEKIVEIGGHERRLLCGKSRLDTQLYQVKIAAWRALWHVILPSFARRLALQIGGSASMFAVPR